MKRFKNILLVVNQREDSKVAFQRAATLATHNQARLTVMAILEDIPQNKFFSKPGSDAAKIINGAIKHSLDQLDELIAASQHQTKTQTTVVHGVSFIEIIRTVIRDKHDLVIKTPRPQHGLKEMLFCSTDMHLLRKCPCPVWMVKSDEVPAYRRILAAVDLEPSDDNARRDDLNLQILEMASSLALSEPGELHIVHAWQVFGESTLQMNRDYLNIDEVDTWMQDQKKSIKTEQQTFMTALPEILGQKGAEFIDPQIHLIQGSAEGVIPRLARDKQIDLLVMGTVARTGLSCFFMGNMAESILNQINCSVLAVKPSGFRTPVTI